MESTKFKALIDRSGLTRKELADRLGVSEKTTFWKIAPRYATAYLELYIEHKEAEITRAQIREWLL